MDFYAQNGTENMLDHTVLFFDGEEIVGQKVGPRPPADAAVADAMHRFVQGGPRQSILLCGHDAIDRAQAAFLSAGGGRLIMLDTIDVLPALLREIEGFLIPILLLLPLPPSPNRLLTQLLNDGICMPILTTATAEAALASRFDIVL